MRKNDLFCRFCGTKLEPKELKNEGIIPFCNTCNEYMFPMFNVAVSMIIMNNDLTKTLFVKQYGTGKNRLVAGYVNKGENAESAVVREMSEEIGIKPIKYTFNATRYFEKSNTLMVNFICVVDEMVLNCNEEIDEYKWYDMSIAEESIREASLAHEFFLLYLDKRQ